LFRILKTHLAARKPDLLHIHNPLDHYPFGVLTARVLGQIAIVNTLHGTNQFDHWSWGRKARVKYWICAMLSDKVVSVCPEVERVVRSKYVLPRKKLSVVENGIDLSRFLAVPARDLRQQVVFGTVALMRPEKNHRLLIESFALARHTYGNIRLRLLGSGRLEPELRALVSKLGLNDVVEFCGYSHDVAGFLGSLDIFVLPSSTEGQPLSLIEAIASGLPVVATDVGGVRNIVQNTRSGWLCPPDNTDAFVEAMQSAITCSERREWAERARQMVAERYSAERMARDYERLYHELL
jgi:glycosyltransferase involved in cell wall biosynthesis